MTASLAVQQPLDEEEQYLTLIRSILASGQLRPDRTGTGTLSIFAPPQLRFSLSTPQTNSGSLILPLLTTKKVFTRGIIEELLWFISGSTDGRVLADKGVNIWQGNGSREYLDSVGLGHRREGDLGPVYGFQWRHFGAEYGTCEDDYSGKGVDQLAEVIRKITENPMDRRIILSAWNPADLSKMALPPCHMFCQFYVTLPSPSSTDQRNRLSCIMYQRSADCGLGVPFNITSYALLLHMIAHITDTIPHEFIHQLGDAHLYVDHLDAMKEQVGRTPMGFPELRFRRTREEISGIDGFRLDDFEVVGYKSWPALKMKMSV